MRLTQLIGLTALLVGTAYLSKFLAAVLHLSREVALLGSMVVLYFAVSFLLSRLRRRLEQSELTQLADEGFSSAQIDEHRVANERKRAEASKAIRIGLVWVNLPIIPIMVGPLVLAKSGFAVRNGWVLGATLVLGFVVAWAWWSVNISLWRRWALRRGVEATELQQQAMEASLVWPRRHLFERTELDSLLLWWNGEQRTACDRADKPRK